MVSHKKFVVYILKCSDGTLYIGKTTDLEKRLKQHNGELKGGAKYTRARNPVQLAYNETFSDHKSCAQREYELKQLSRSEKIILIQNSAKA